MILQILVIVYPQYNKFINEANLMQLKINLLLYEYLLYLPLPKTK